MNTKNLHGQSEVAMHHVQSKFDSTLETVALSLFMVPYLGAAVLEELKEFRDHDVERPVESVAVQQLRRVLADLLQCSKRALRHGHTQRGCQIKNANAHRHKGEEQQLHQKTRLGAGVNTRCTCSAKE